MFGFGLEISKDHSSAMPIEISEERLAVFRKHWHEAHVYPITVRHWSVEAAQDWYANWKDRIPATCECSTHWNVLEARNPITFSTDQSLARWFHERHNEVNDHVRRSDDDHRNITWNECCELYGYPLEWLAAGT